MIKKLISAVAATAIAVTAFAGLVSAEKTYDIRLDSGVSYTEDVDEFGSQYFTVWCDDIVEEYTSGMTIKIRVISGEVGTDSAMEEFKVVGGLETNRGLYTPGRSKSYLASSAFTQNISRDAEGNQLITIAIGLTKPAMTDDGMLCEFYVTPLDSSADIELEIVNDVDDGGKGLTNIITCTSENSNKVEHYFTPEVAPQYVLAAGTSTITEKTQGGPTTVTTDANFVQNAVAGSEEVYIKDSESAVAYWAEGDFTQGKSSAYWTATINGANKKKDVAVPNITGKAKLGIVIVGATSVEAVKLNVVTQ